MPSKTVTKTVGYSTGEEPYPFENRIKAFFHCRQCIEEKPDGISPRDWAQLEVGWTRYGIQVWCKRHERNVEHFHLMGNKVRSVTSDEDEADT